MINKTEENQSETQSQSQTPPPIQEFALKIDDLRIQKGELVAVIGKIGSGKSSLLLSLLNELILTPGDFFEFSINPSIAYVEQKPWIINGSVRENILMGSPFDEKKYSEVITYSGLKPDLEILKGSDSAIIGDKGINLSGGQKVRLSLARALYQDKNIYLLDDPLSALDVNVGSFIMNQMVLKKLAGKTRVVVTHNLNHLSSFDRILLMMEGKVIFSGTYKEIQSQENFINIQNILKKTELEMDIKPSEVNQTKEEIDLSKPFVSVQVGDNNIDDLNVRKELEENQEVAFSSYFNYLSLGRMYNLMLLIAIMLVNMFFAGYSYYFYNQASKNHRADFNPTYFIQMFVAINLVLGMTQFLRILFCYLFGINISMKLHGLMLVRVLYSSINGFFNKNPIGKVLNRFSGDLMTIDTGISYNQSTLLQFTSTLIVNLILIVTFTKWFLGIFYLIIFYFLWKMRMSFSVANIIMKKYESVTKSPYYNLFSDFVNGNYIIKTYQKEDYYMQKTTQIVNKNFRCVLLNQGMKSWFSLRIFTSIFVFTIPVYTYVLLFNQESLFYISILVVSMIKLLNNTIYLMNVINNFENNMVSFERCFAYTQLPHEPGMKSITHEQEQLLNNETRIVEEGDKQLFDRLKIPQKIEKGVILFKGVGAKYSEDSEQVLKDLNF